MKFDNTLMTLVKKDIDNGLIPMLLGEPGIGKSSWLQNLAKLMRTECFTLACNQLADKADLTGARLVPIADKDGNIVDYKQMFYPHAVIHDAITYAESHPRETPILFMDELNRTTPDVTSEALSIPTLRSIGSKQLPDNLRVVIAGNDKGNVTSLDEASVSRFVLYKVTPDVHTFLSLDPELNPFVRDTLQAHPDCIFCKTIRDNTESDDTDDNDIDDILDDGEDMAQITTPRTISAVSRWLNSFTNSELLELLSDTHTEDGQEVSVLQEAIEGHVGRTSFSTYLLATIASKAMSTNNQSTSLTVTKPACYDDMKMSGDMTALAEKIDHMTDNEKSGCLLYSIYEKANNEVYIKVLAGTVNKLMPDDMQTLMKLSVSNKLDQENVHTLLNTKTAISQALSVILEMA